MASSNVHEFTSENFEAEVLQSDLPVIVFFTAIWSSHCQPHVLIVEEIANDFKGKVKVGKLDFGENPEIAKKYSISAIPTFLMFKGGEKVRQFVGNAPTDRSTWARVIAHYFV